MGRWMGVKDQGAGPLGIPRLTVPWLRLQARHLRDRGESFNSIDLQIRFLDARNFGEREDVRRSRHRMALKEMLTGDTIGRTNNRGRPTLQMREYPGTDRLVVMLEIEFRHQFAVTGVGPEDFFGLRDWQTHNDRIVAIFRRIRRTDFLHP